MSEQNTFKIPTASETAKEVIAQMAASGYIVPSGALDIDAAAAWLKCSTKHLRALVELNKIQARNISAGTGEKSTLRFSIRELDKFLTGEYRGHERRRASGRICVEQIRLLFVHAGLAKHSLF